MFLTSCDLISTFFNENDNSNEIWALLGLYDYCHGCNWTRQDNWGSALPLSEWYGISTDSEGFVTGINLNGNNLTGSLRIDLNAFPHLTSFTIDDNPLESISIAPNQHIKRLTFKNCANNEMYIYGALEKLEVIDCDSLYYIRADTTYIDSLYLKDCHFRVDRYRPHMDLQADVVQIEGCTMSAIGVESNVLSFTNSVTLYDWYCLTKENLIIADSYCCGISEHNFYSSTQIQLINATLLHFDTSQKFTKDLLGKDWNTLWSSN